MLTALLLGLGDTALAAALRQSTIAYPLVSSAHILGLGLLVGSIVVLDLRLLGVIKRGAVTDLLQLMSRVAATGLFVAVLTGILLFSVQPNHYLSNPAFLTKIVIIVLGLLNIAAVHSLPQWRSLVRVQQAQAVRIPLVIKIFAALSLLFWISALIAGRWIAFV